MTLRIPIRFKIVALITAALAVSLASYLILGTKLVERDKVSYVYDHNLSRVQSVSEWLNAEFARLETSAKALVRGQSLPGAEPVDIAYGAQLDTRSVPGFLILRPDGENEFRIESSAGERQTEARSLFEAQGWTPKSYAQHELLLGAESAGFLPVGGRTLDSVGEPVAWFALLRIQPPAQELNHGFSFQILDATGRALHSSERAPNAQPVAQEAFANSLPAGFASGARDWTVGGVEYLTSYQRIRNNRVTVVGFTLKEEAFEAARQLVRKSLVLGLSVLFLSIGLTLVFARGITSRLRRMWAITQSISQGDFSKRVEFSKRAPDELTDLASSFNLMSEKIELLIEHTAEKARLENELATAQLVQNRFFPTAPFSNPNASIAGDYIPASECGGDWWSYASLGDRVLVVIGDVIGHGASAALVTAVAHGAFSAFVHAQNSAPAAAGGVSSPELVRRLISQLNRAVYAASDNKVTMTFLAYVLDLRSGMLTLANAAHCTPYVFRPGKSENPVKCFSPIMEAKGQSLGYGPELDIEPFETALEPGDLVFSYSDGLLECQNAEGATLRKLSLLKSLATLHQSSSDDASRVSSGVLSGFMEFLGDARLNRMDDVTIVAVCIPKSARFERVSRPVPPPFHAETRSA